MGVYPPDPSLKVRHPVQLRAGGEARIQGIGPFEFFYRRMIIPRPRPGTPVPAPGRGGALLAGWRVTGPGHRMIERSWGRGSEGLTRKKAGGWGIIFLTDSSICAKVLADPKPKGRQRTMTKTWTDWAASDVGHLWADWAAQHGVEREDFLRGLELIEQDPNYWADRGFRSLWSSAERSRDND
jgi:hypothetical protein